MTPSLLVAATGCSPANAEIFASPIRQAISYIEATNSPDRQAMFLANVAHECARFEKLTESLNYSVEGLLKGFGRHRISEADARAYGRIDGKRAANQEAIANCIYGCDWAKKALGNVRAGDGWMFIGRGPFNVTGRANYARTRDGMRFDLGRDVPDFEEHPELLAQPLWGSLGAALYWRRNGLNAYADRGNFDGVCDFINLGKLTPAYGDSKGFADRKALYDRARKALGA